MTEELSDYRKAYHSVLETERDGGPVTPKETVLPADRRWVRYIPPTEEQVNEQKKQKAARRNP